MASENVQSADSKSMSKIGLQCFFWSLALGLFLFNYSNNYNYYFLCPKVHSIHETGKHLFKRTK